MIYLSNKVSGSSDRSMQEHCISGFNFLFGRKHLINIKVFLSIGSARLNHLFDLGNNRFEKTMLASRAEANRRDRRD